MSDLRLHCRLAVLVLACLAVGGCSLLRHGAKPEAPPPPAVAVAVAAVPASSVARAGPAASAPSSEAPASSRGWDPAVAHLDPEAMIGQTWVFPSFDPRVYRDNRFVFRRDRLEASNAREHVTGTWTVERDKLCVTLHAGATGSVCYYVTGTPPSGLQIRALPDGERVPLRIE